MIFGFIFSYLFLSICSTIVGSENLVSLDIKQTIFSIFLQRSSRDDSLVWGLIPDDVYSVKTGALLV